MSTLCPFTFNCAVMTMNKATLFAGTLLLSSGCSNFGETPSESSKRIYNEMKINHFESIDFKNIGDEKWTKVCFFGPGSQEYSSSDTLGFKWDVNDYTDVLASSNDFNVIVFATDNEVTEHVIHKKNHGDFSKLSRRCYKRASSRFTKGQPDDSGWVSYNTFVETGKNQSYY